MFVLFEKDISENKININKNLSLDYNYIEFDYEENIKGIYFLNKISKEYIENNFQGIQKIFEINTPYKFSSREFKNEDTIVNIGNLKIGGNNFQKIGGPCSFENEEMFKNIAFNLKSLGTNIIRGGAFKPRSSPYFFQGIGENALKSMNKIAKELDVKIVSEIISTEYIELFNEYVDIIQVGTRNMQNYELLKALGKINKPILLKRGLSATIEEFLLSAEYIISNGNINVILCERGIRTFEKITRNTLDVSAVPVVKKLSHLPIIIDPSHAAGSYDLVESLSLAGVAAGCHGVMIEVHNDPKNALSDGMQSIKIGTFKDISNKIDKIREVLF